MRGSDPVPRGEVVKRSLARTDPVYFVVNQIGIRPHTWQGALLRKLAEGDSCMACTARQLGKTAAIAWFCLWACIYNVFPIETTKRTRIIIVSATEDQSKKIINDIREFMLVGDDHLAQITGRRTTDKDTGKPIIVGALENWFTNQIDKNAKNNTEAITFTNKCEIISLPPTKKVRGYTGSWLIVDEAAFIDSEDLFEQTFRNVVARTGNRILMTSTPNGQQGFFYKHFDPEDEAKTHEFERFWIPYTAIRLDDPKTYEIRKQLEETSVMLGNERSFHQEHMASFNSSTTNFFDADDVDRGAVSGMTTLTRYDKPCDIGVDFGAGKVSRTVVTISALEGKGSDAYIRLIYQYEYKPGTELTLITDIEELMKSFKVQRVIFEDCPAAEIPRQAAEKKGWNLKMFNPSADKGRKYYAFKHWLRSRKLKYPYIDDLMRQMKGLIEEETATRTKIHHGNGLLDDRIDSFVISTYFFTEEGKNFKVWDWEEL